jgi:PPOX class probable F420-dependent enzyme
MNNTLKQFEKQQYLNIETFRKNGQGVKTPVWFAQDGDTLHVWTETSSGKAKRIRRDGNVRIAPSTASGEALGEWINARATAHDSESKVKETEALFKKKYGVVFVILSNLNKWRGGKYASVEIVAS